VLVQTFSGERYWYKTQNPWAWQGFGRVLARYPKRGLIKFQPPDQEGAADNRLPIAFNDNARATLKGSLNYELPLVDEKLDALHAAYPSQDSLESGLVKPSLNKSIFLTGTLMTSYESYKEKRSMLIQYVEDQTESGVYRTDTVEREIEEEALDINGQPVMRKKVVSEVVIAKHPVGHPQAGQSIRNEVGQMERFGVQAFGFAIEDIDYEESVDKQIKDQQAITMSVQTSMANAKKAIQDAITAKAQGDANVAEARAAEEIGKTKAVVNAEKMRDVAKLSAEQAGFYKQEQLLRADADSEYKRRIMNADGALQQRLDAYKYGVEKIAGAIASYQGQWTPSVMIGGAAGTGGSFNAVQGLLDMALVNQAKQLGLDLGIPRQSSALPREAPVAARKPAGAQAEKALAKQ
jgi:hypothetical protein